MSKKGYTRVMGLYSAIFGGGSKKKSPEELQKIARGQSVVGNVLGSSPYMDEWRRQNKQNSENYAQQERSMRKKWGYEDAEMNRSLQKERDRYYRKYKDPKEAEKWFSQYEAKKRREVQGERDRELRALKEEKNQQQRDIAKNIKQWR